MKNILFTAIILLSFFTNGLTQVCNCAESFNWLVKTFEKNDAGFQYVIDKKGIDDYNAFTAKTKAKAGNITTLNECQNTMAGWLKYFRAGHQFVNIKESNQSTNETSKAMSESDIRKKFKNEKTINLTEKQLISILDKKKNKHPIEGIWTNGNYTIGIINDEQNSKKYSAFIINADNVYWMPKQVKAELFLNGDNKTFAVDFYMRDHSKQLTSAFFVSKTFNLLNLYGGNWQRLYPTNQLSKKETLILAFSTAQKPFIEQISTKTLYLRIPSFDYPQKRAIDSVLAKHQHLITSTPNLIIDIRNGTGGSDVCYEKIIPFLYTNPIRNLGTRFLATEQNTIAFENYATTLKNDTTAANYCKNIVSKMKINMGKFITVSDKTYEIDSLHKVSPFPKSVGIICNQRNGSTDEEFLLAAKQSKKVKIFGKPTAGILDISNMNEIDFPNGQFVLGYAMSQSFRIPNFCIDGVGIQPDYFMDDTLPDDEWIEYTQMILE
jgi:Peptidase family S41